MSAAAQIGAGRQAMPTLTTAQVTALRLMRSGALIRAANGSWYSRAFPAQPVSEITVTRLVDKGMATVSAYVGLYEERRCAVPTPLGAAFNAGRRYAPVSAPPPVTAEVVLHEVEQAIAVLDRENDALRAQILQDSAAVREGRRTLAKAEASLAAAEKRLTERERARESLNLRRVDLRALVAHACERLGTEMAGAGR